MSTKKEIVTVDLAPLYSELGELKKNQQGIMHDLSAQNGLTDKIQAAIFLANANGRNPGQNPNPADAGLGTVDWPAFSSGAFMSPANPVLPVNPELTPRQFAYAPGVNLRFVPRMGYGLLDFATLRGLSFACKEIRLNIEKIKSTIRGLDHEFVLDKAYSKANNISYQANPKLIDDVSLFWEKPDGIHDFDNYVNMALEELLVTDSLTIYPDEDGTITMIDGTTIRPTTSYAGKIPPPPAPAYIQVLYGYPRWWCDRKHMYYDPMRASVFSPYGVSPIEFIIQATVAAIKKDSSLVQNYTEGNIPASFAGLPSTWTVDQIKEFTEWYNVMIQGDVARRSKVMFMPHDGSGNIVQQMTQGDIDETTLDEWLMTVACWAYGNDKSEFGILSGSGLGGKGALQGGENAQVRGMISVYTRFLSQLFNAVNRDILHAPYAKSHWIGLEPPEDELNSAKVDQIYVGLVYSADYVADRLGIEEKYRIKNPPTPPTPATPEGYVANTSKVMTQGATTQTPAVQTPEQALKYQQRAFEADLKTWGEKAERFAKKGWQQTEFTDTVLPDELRKAIFTQVQIAKTPEAVHVIFADALGSAKEGLAKSMTHPAVDPNQVVKDAASNEMERAMREYLAGLMNRIAAKSVELK